MSIFDLIKKKLLEGEQTVEGRNPFSGVNISPDAGMMPNDNTQALGNPFSGYTNPYPQEEAQTGSFSGVNIEQPVPKDDDVSGGQWYDPMNPPYGMTPPFIDPRNQRTQQSGIFPVAAEVAPTQPTPAPIYPIAQSDSTQNRINTINNKDYSKAVKDENGNIIKEAGKDRDKKWSTLEKFGNAALGAFIGLGQGGIGGAITGGVMGATDRNFNEKQADKRELGNLYPRLAQEQQAENYQQKRDMTNAQLGEIKRRPEKEAQARQDKFDFEAERQLGRMKDIAEKDRLAGKKYKIEVLPNGRVVKKYPDREEPFLDEKGNQEYSLIDRPEEVEVEDGVNADGTPKTKKVYMKGGQYANLKSSENYREAMLGLNRERLEESKSQFEKKFKLDVAKFGQAKKEFETVTSMRQKTFDAMEKARANNDEQAYNRLRLDLDKFDTNLEAMLTRARQAEKEGELDESQLNEIETFVRTKRGK